MRTVVTGAGVRAAVLASVTPEEVRTLLAESQEALTAAADVVLTPCLVGAVLAEQHDEWTEGRRYCGLEILTRARSATDPASTTEEAAPTPTIPALSA